MTTNGHLCIRADATTAIGSGHVMRCLALAQEARKRGLRSKFVGKIAQQLVDRLRCEGMEVTPWEEDTSVSDDLACLLGAADGSAAVVLDHYDLGPDYQRTIHEAGHNVLVVDDCNHQPEYVADFVLNQNLCAPKYRYNTQAKLLLGPHYALLRSEFLDHARPEPESRGRVRKLLVTLGGADPENFTFRVLQALQLVRPQEMHIKVILGPSFPWRKDIEAFLDKNQMEVELHSDVSNMSDLYEWADAAITAGGSTVYELAYFRLPAAVFSLADNQVETITEFNKSRLICFLGKKNDADIYRMSRNIETFINDSLALECQSHRLGKVVDGNGAKRVIDCILNNKSISKLQTSFKKLKVDFIRPANINDNALLLEWANDPMVRSMAFTSTKILQNEHSKWFLNRINNENCYIFIAEGFETEPIGQVRFEKNEEKFYEVDISIANMYRGCGLAHVVLSKCIEAFLGKIMKPVDILAFVKIENSFSIAVFLKCGFKYTQTLVKKNSICYEFTSKFQ